MIPFSPDAPLDPQPAPVDQPSPTKSPDPQSTWKFEPGHVFELMIASTRLAFFVLSSDLNVCAVCNASGGNMGEASAHHPFCLVADMWRAIDRFKVSLEVR